jgi:hypothetical protein
LIDRCAMANPRSSASLFTLPERAPRPSNYYVCGG